MASAHGRQILPATANQQARCGVPIPVGADVMFKDLSSHNGDVLMIYGRIIGEEPPQLFLTFPTTTHTLTQSPFSPSFHRTHTHRDSTHPLPHPLTRLDGDAGLMNGGRRKSKFMITLFNHFC